jgi:hypothetical protein
VGVGSVWGEFFKWCTSGWQSFDMLMALKEDGARGELLLSGYSVVVSAGTNDLRSVGRSPLRLPLEFVLTQYRKHMADVICLLLTTYKADHVYVIMPSPFGFEGATLHGHRQMRQSVLELTSAWTQASPVDLFSACLRRESTDRRTKSGKHVGKILSTQVVDLSLLKDYYHYANNRKVPDLVHLSLKGYDVLSGLLLVALAKTEMDWDLRSYFSESEVKKAEEAVQKAWVKEEEPTLDCVRFGTVWAHKRIAFVREVFERVGESALASERHVEMVEECEIVREAVVLVRELSDVVVEVMME